VTVLQGREAVAVVLLCIVIISDADQLGLQKMDHGRQHLFARQSAQGHVLPDLLSDGGQCLGEGNDMLVLRAFSHLTEARVAFGQIAPRDPGPQHVKYCIYDPSIVRARALPDSSALAAQEQTIPHR
jgi:hypothetical protein